MVALSEVKNMFWGITLDGGKRYTQTVDNAYHISMAALEPVPQEDKPDPYVSVMLQHNKAEFLLCTLERGRVMQQLLDLNFAEGEEITIFLNGKGVVHLTGYLMEDDDPSMCEEMDSSDGEVPQLAGYSSDEEDIFSKGKRKKKQLAKQIQKKMKAGVFDDEDSSDAEYDEDADDSYGSLHDFLDDEAEEDSDEDDDDDDFEEDSDAEEYLARISSGGMTAPQKTQQHKKKKKTEEMPNGKDTPSKKSKFDVKKNAESTPSKKNKNNSSKIDTPKKEKNKTVSTTPKTDTPKKESKNQVTPHGKDKGKKSQPGTPASGKKSQKAKKVLEGGVIAEDVKEGHGPPAKPGKTVHVYYTGRLQNGKMFDSSTTGKPFKFKLGKREVIKGWDLGLEGMNVGSKRKLTIPPKMAYGKQRMGDIPPNSTLIFDVEMKAVS